MNANAANVEVHAQRVRDPRAKNQSVFRAAAFAATQTDARDLAGLARSHAR
jgi:hypothetical protein